LQQSFFQSPPCVLVLLSAGSKQQGTLRNSNHVFCFVVFFYFFTLEPTKEPDEEKKSYAIIFGVSLGGGLFVLALASICLIRFCKRNKMGGRNRRHSGIMPSEEAFPNREKYELKNAKSAEKVIYFEQVGVWSKSMKGESNEAFE